MTNLLETESKFQQVAWFIKTRSELYLRAIPLIKDKEGIGEEIEPEEIRKILGPTLTDDLADYTNALIEHVDDTIKSLEKTRDKLHTALNDLYPNKGIQTWAKVRKE